MSAASRSVEGKSTAAHEAPVVAAPKAAELVEVAAGEEEAAAVAPV